MAPRQVHGSVRPALRRLDSYHHICRCTTLFASETNLLHRKKFLRSPFYSYRSMAGAYGSFGTSPTRNTSRGVLARVGLLVTAVLLFTCAAIASVRVESVDVPGTQQLAGASAAAGKDATPPAAGKDATPPAAGKGATPSAAGKDATPPAAAKEASSSSSASSDGDSDADIVISPIPTYEQKERALQEIARLTRQIAKATRERVSP